MGRISQGLVLVHAQRILLTPTTPMPIMIPEDACKCAPKELFPTISKENAGTILRTAPMVGVMITITAVPTFVQVLILGILTVIISLPFVLFVVVQAHGLITTQELEFVWRCALAHMTVRVFLTLALMIVLATIILNVVFNIVSLLALGQIGKPIVAKVDAQVMIVALFPHTLKM